MKLFWFVGVMLLGFASIQAQEAYFVNRIDYGGPLQVRTDARSNVVFYPERMSGPDEVIFIIFQTREGASLHMDLADARLTGRNQGLMMGSKDLIKSFYFTDQSPFDNYKGQGVILVKMSLKEAAPYFESEGKVAATPNILAAVDCGCIPDARPQDCTFGGEGATTCGTEEPKSLFAPLPSGKSVACYTACAKGYFACCFLEEQSK